MSGRTASKYAREKSESKSQMEVVDINIDLVYSAPRDWNKWKPLSQDKFAELVESILTIGQEQNCIVWKISKQSLKEYYHEDEYENDMYGFSGSDYMIVAGHNRTKARLEARKIRQKEIEQKSKDIELDYYGDNDEKLENEFDFVPCTIKTEPLTDEGINNIRNIIVDTNYASRDNTPEENYFAIMFKYMNYTANPERKTDGDLASKIAEELNVGRATVFRYLKLKDLIEPFRKELFDNKLSMKSALKISDFDADQQDYLYNNWLPSLENKKTGQKIISKIEPHMKKQHLENIINAELGICSYETVTLKVPKHLTKEFKEYARQWLKRKTSENNN